MRSNFLAPCVLALVLCHCGSSGGGDDTAVDASGDRTSPADGAQSDGSNADGAVSDSSADDSSWIGDSQPDDAGNLCDPNNPKSCPLNMKCCSEPTHKMPPSIYECVTPGTNGTCPLFP